MSKICPTCNTTFPDNKAFCPEDGTPLRATDVGSGLIGSVIADRYVVTELLGEGGMGKVYLARHVRLPRQAAIKVLHANMVQDADALARFNREATSASQIDHDRVARVFDFGETADGLVYLAMEYVEGRTLKRVLTDDGPMSLTRGAAIVRQVADALDAAHRLDIVHRDLTPDNILVGKDDRGLDRCKVVDFGIAKAIGSGERALTRTGFVIGTPEYMSPEQLLGEPIDHRSDVYALALLAYQCLTGETAFNSKTPDRGLMARLTSEPRDLLEVRPDKEWPAEVQAVLSKGLARDRTERFTSAGALAGALEKAVRSKVMAVPAAAPDEPSPSPRAGKQEPAGKRDRQAARTPSAPVAPPPPPPGVPYGAPFGVPYGAPMGVPSTPAPLPARRRRWRVPRLPLLRWSATLLVVWFGWLVISEGSVPRAVAKAKATARTVQTEAKQFLARVGI